MKTTASVLRAIANEIAEKVQKEIKDFSPDSIIINEWYNNGKYFCETDNKGTRNVLVYNIKTNSITFDLGE